MIELVDVCLDRGETKILDTVNLRVDPGQVVLLSGPSGIGKTSLLSMIGGFLTANSGAVLVFNHNVAKMRATSTALLRRRLAFVPQELALIDDESALANVRLALEVCGVSSREANGRARDVLASVDLEDQMLSMVSDLSTGQRRRVSLARGMIRDAEIFVADEPTNDLDAERVLMMVEHLEEMREGETAIVVATNDPRLLAHAAQPEWRHIAIKDHKIVEGSMSTLFKEGAPARQLDEGDTAENVLPFPDRIAGDGN